MNNSIENHFSDAKARSSWLEARGYFLSTTPGWPKKNEPNAN